MAIELARSKYVSLDIELAQAEDELREELRAITRTFTIKMVALMLCACLYFGALAFFNRDGVLEMPSW
jgi:flagellar basal body-associated protein FliL